MMINGSRILFTGIFLATVNGIRTDSVCGQSIEDSVLLVCAEKTLYNVKYAYLDTSETPLFEEVECVCTIELATQTQPAETQPTVKVTFVSGSSIEDSSFTIPGNNEIILNSTADTATVDLMAPGVILIYRQSNIYTDISCLNISVVSAGDTINVSCYKVGEYNYDLPDAYTERTTRTHRKEETGMTTVVTGSPNQTLIYANDVQEENNFPTVAVAAGTGGGIALILIVTAVILLLKRSRNKSTQQTSSDDDSEDEDVENPMYNMVDIDTGTSDTKQTNSKVYDNKAKTPGEHVPVSIVTFGSRNFEEVGYAYAKPRDSITNDLTESGYVYSTPIEEGIQHNNSIDKSSSGYSYSTGLKPKTESNKPCSNAKPKPAKLAKNVRNNDNVYDHTGDKSHAVPMNEYSHLKKVPVRQVACLNDYATTGNTPHGQGKSTHEEDHYDHTN